MRPEPRLDTVAALPDTAQVPLLEDSIVQGTPNLWRGDVVIVGGGLSGLAAARALVEKGKTVVVLEAKSDVGGRMIREQVSRGGRTGWVDLGGQWIGREHHRLVKLAEALHVATFPWHHEGKAILHFTDGQRIQHGYVGDDFQPYPGEPYPLTQEQWQDYDRIKHSYEDLASQVPPAEPWTWSQADVRDHQILEQWIDSTATTSFGKWTVAMLARIGGSGAFEPKDTSALHYFWTQRVAAQKDEPEDRLFTGGAGQIAGLLRDRLPDSVVRTDQPVTEIRQDDVEGVAVFAGTGGVYLASRVIVAIPPPQVRKITFVPKLPDIRVALLGGSPMGAIIKAHVIYDEPWWRRDGLSGIGQGNLQTIEFTADSSESSELRPLGILTSFIAGDRAKELTNRSRAEREAYVLQDCATYFGERAKTTPHDYIEKNWPADPWIPGAFTTYMKPGVWTGPGRAVRAPCGRIHWAGTETAVCWPGYFEGALDAATRAVDEVLKA
jgi:L-amino acid dehydrogenase